jgi:alanyl-tRNA synthetase
VGPGNFKPSETSRSTGRRNNISPLNMTKRLYYEDAYLREFSASVVAESSREGCPLITLDRTAFYPSSGGQPHDTGILGASRVLNVEEDSSGNIVHLLDQPLPVGPVRGSVDWERRFDHMQQHTGQHILSQAFIRVGNAATLAFHMGQEASTIDLDVLKPPQSLIDAAEQLANAVIFEDRPVNIRTAERDQLQALGIRKETDRGGSIRVIDVEGFDRSACGGTHVRRAGEVGMLFILGWENYKRGVRIEFVCGGRTLTALRHDHEIVRQLSRTCSAHAKELPRLMEKMIQDRSELARENARLQDRLLDVEAIELLRTADAGVGAQVVTRVYSDRPLEALKVLAQKLTSHPGILAILGLISQETAQVVVARSSSIRGNCGAAIKAVAAKMGGKGGGKPEQAQAGGIPGDRLPEWMQAVAEALALQDA